MSTVNMKAVQKLVDAAQVAFDAWKAAGSFALTQHTGYVPALKANAASRAASEEVRGYMNALLGTLHADPSTDPSWFQKIGAIRDNAIYQVSTLDNAKQLLLADLAQHVKLTIPPAEAQKFGTAIDAAAAVDAKTKAAAANPNARKPSTQDTSLPPVDAPPDTGDVPPEEASPPSWGLWAGIVAGGALLLKILKVW